MTDSSVSDGAVLSAIGSSAVLVAGYVFLAANMDFAPRLTWHDGQRLAQLALFASCVMLMIARDMRRSTAVVWAAIPTWSRFALYAALASGLLSALLAPLARWAVLDLAALVLLSFTMLSVAAGRLVCRAALDRLLLLMLLLTAAGYAAKTVVVYVAMLTVGAGYGMAFNVRDLYTGFSNIRFFGHLQTMMLPLLLLPAMLWAKTGRRRVLWGIVPVIWWMLMVASGTRGTWVALAMGAVTAAIFGGRVGRRWIAWQFAGLAGGLICYSLFILWVPGLFEQPATFLHRSNDLVSLSLREVIWNAALEFTRKAPLLGVGPMHFAYYANEVAAHPHNIVLQLMCEWGVPAMILIMVVFAGGGLAFARHVKRATAGPETQTGLVAVALLSAISGAATQAMVDGVLVMPASQVTLALICGWAMGLYFQGNTAQVKPIRLEKLLCAAMVVLAAAAVTYCVAPEIGKLEQREKDYLASRPPGTILLPRFWAQGWINP